MTVLSERKEHLLTFLSNDSNHTDVKALSLLDYQSLQTELDYLIKFENEVCPLDKVLDPKSYVSWLESKSPTLSTKTKKWLSMKSWYPNTLSDFRK